MEISKGYSIVEVDCPICGKIHKTIIENVDKKRALKNYAFLCGECRGD